jgi:UDP-N-acetylmuramoyl-tripeptide--D-alanyl-D-alanine ligase
VCDLALKIICVLSVACASGYFFHKRILRYLQYLQQEDYNGTRFWQWCQRKRAFDRRGASVAFASGIITGLFTGFNFAFGCFVGATLTVGLFLTTSREEDPTKTGKVTLKLTERARRILGTAEAINALVLFALVLVSLLLMGQLAPPFIWLTQVIVFQIQPLVLVTAKVLLDRQEEEIQTGFADQARAILSGIDPIVVGITGSYGKTSCKVILSEILGTIAPTFTTPRSVNSLMGVTKEIRERLQPRHRYSVIEMGAYQVGSIAKMCSLTPPKVGLVTAVGEMHLERFGTVENIFKAKSELAQALPADGILVVNGDYEYCRLMAKENPKRLTLIYGFDQSKGPLDAYMFDVHTSEAGSNFKIKYVNNEYSGFTRLLGKPMLSNVLGCFSVAVALGIAPEVALAVIRNVKTEANRLELVKTDLQGLAPILNGSKRDSKVVRLNDAFNSNPVGFKSALEVLQELPGKRKILVTPGMIELGDRQVAENESAGKEAASVCDYVVVVGETNKESLLKGLSTGGMQNDKIQTQSSMKDALSFLASKYCDDGDVVLIENDLPDLYESAPVF